MRSKIKSKSNLYSLIGSFRLTIDLRIICRWRKYWHFYFDKYCLSELRYKSSISVTDNWSRYTSIMFNKIVNNYFNLSRRILYIYIRYQQDLLDKLIDNSKKSVETVFFNNRKSYNSVYSNRVERNSWSNYRNKLAISKVLLDLIQLTVRTIRDIYTQTFE